MVKMLTSSTSNASLVTQTYTFSVYDSLSYKTTVKTDRSFSLIWTEQNQVILQTSLISMNLKLQHTSLDTC